MLKKMLLIGLIACSSVIANANSNPPAFTGNDICSKKEYDQLNIIFAKHNEILPLISSLNFYARIGKSKEVIEYVDKAIQLTTKKIKNVSDKNKVLFFLFITRALYNLGLKNYKSTIEDCTNALKHDKNKACAYYLKALAYFQLNQIETAFSYIKTAAKKGSPQAKYIVSKNPKMYEYVDEAEEK